MSRLHRSLGWVFGVPLALLGISGALLVYRDAFERAARSTVPDAVRAGGRTPLPWQTVAGRVLDAHPGHRILSFQRPGRADAPLEILLLPPRGGVVMVAADPYTGAPLGVLRGDRRIWLDPIARLHFHAAAALLAAPLLVLVVTGFFRRRQRPGLHTRLGLAGSAVLLFYASSGALFHLAPRPALRAPLAPHDFLAPLDRFRQAAEAALPGATVSYIELPATRTAPVKVRLRQAGELRATGGNDVFLHPETAAVLQVEPMAPGAYRWWYLNLAALHYGEPAPPFFAACGLLPLALWLTGLRRR